MNQFRLNTATLKLNQTYNLSSLKTVNVTDFCTHQQLNASEGNAQFSAPVKTRSLPVSNVIDDTGRKNNKHFIWFETCDANVGGLPITLSWSVTTGPQTASRLSSRHFRKGQSHCRLSLAGTACTHLYRFDVQRGSATLIATFLPNVWSK